MSVATVTAITTTTAELTDALSGAAATIAGSVSAIAWPLAAVAAAVEVGNLFGKVWNKNRSKIPELNESLRLAVNSAIDLNRDVIKDSLDKANAFLADPENINKMDLIKNVLKSDIQKDIERITKGLDDFAEAVYQQEISWATTLAIFYIAQTDNSFYTLNKGKVDNLIDAYTSSTVDTKPLVDTGTQSAAALDSLIDAVDTQYRRASFIVAVLLEPPTRIPYPNEVNRIRDLLNGVRTRRVTIESLTTTIPTLDELAQYLLSKSASITKTRAKTKESKLKRRRKRKLRKKKEKKKTPQMIQKMWINTQNSSRWISKVEFTFPTRQDIDSDNKGTLKFYLKKGGTIRKVRVRRGTFSTIAVWSVGTKLGVGYRYWSQFNKSAIVNKKVFSYSLARINAQDREIAIPIEILEKRVKYR